MTKKERGIEFDGLSTNRIDKMKSKKKAKKWLILYTVLGSLITLGFSFGIYFFAVYGDAVNTTNKMYTEVRKTEDKIDKIVESKSNAQIGILLMGIDNDEERSALTNIEGERSDTLIYITYNGKYNEINMVSIPRDVFTDIYDGDGNIIDTGKINSAYAYGQELGAIETVENFLNVPVDYYATVNFISFKKIIDSIGGVTVEVPYNVYSNYKSDFNTNSGELLLEEGTQHLNGEQALIFSRMRKLDNDIERGKRQQEVIEAVLKQIVSVNTLDNYVDIFESVGDNVKTDLDFNNIMELSKGYIAHSNDFRIKSYTFDWTGFDLNGQSNVAVYDDSLEYISHKLRRSLSLDKKDEVLDGKDFEFVTNEYSSTILTYRGY